MESMCNELNILQRKFAPTLKARIQSVHEDMTNQRDTAQRFQGYMLIVPTSRTCTEADLTDILEAWATFIHSKKHEHWSESDGVADYISALRFTINPGGTIMHVSVECIMVPGSLVLHRRCAYLTSHTQASCKEASKLFMRRWNQTQTGSDSCCEP